MLNKQVGGGKYYKKKCITKKVGNNGSSFSTPEMVKQNICVRVCNIYCHHPDHAALVRVGDEQRPENDLTNLAPAPTDSTLSHTFTPILY